MRIAIVLLALLAFGCAPQESPETKYNNLTKMIEEKDKLIKEYQTYVNNFSGAISPDGTRLFNQGKESELSKDDKFYVKSLRECTKILLEAEDKRSELIRRRDALGF